MTHYRSLSHTKWTCQYHVVFNPKYRKKVIVKGGAKLDHSGGGKLDHLATGRSS